MVFSVKISGFVLLFLSIACGQISARADELNKRLKVSETDSATVNYSGDRAARIEETLKKRGFTKVKVVEERGWIVLRGTFPKGKLLEVIQLAQTANDGKPLKNELTEE